jgi:hypothetical protein
LKETELAQHFIKYFADHEIYSEVKAAATIDFVAKKNDFTIGVEVKTKMNFEVIGQAYYNRNHFHQIYVAVPFKKGDFSFEICKILGIGVLLYIEKGNKVYEKIKPENRIPKYQPKIREYNKMSVAGSQNDRMTDFKWTLVQIVEYLKTNDGAKLDTVLDNVKFHWKTKATAMSCLRKYNTKGILKEFKIEKGKVYLNGKEDTKEN